MKKAMLDSSKVSFAVWIHSDSYWSKEWGLWAVTDALDAIEAKHLFTAYFLKVADGHVATQEDVQMTLMEFLRIGSSNPQLGLDQKLVKSALMLRAEDKICIRNSTERALLWHCVSSWRRHWCTTSARRSESNNFDLPAFDGCLTDLMLYVWCDFVIKSLVCS